MADLISDVERHRREVVTDSYTITWNEAVALYQKKNIHIDPDYQRMFRWTLDQQTQFIESLLLNIPTPPLFFAEDKSGTFELIDGLQRFSTLLKFFSSEVFQKSKLRIKEGKKESVNNIRVPTTLRKGPILGTLEGITLETMPEQLVRTVRYARIQIILLKKESDPRTRYTVFHRLNRSGSPLSDQEIRNSAARLFSNTFADALRTIAKTQDARRAMHLSHKQRQTMIGEEMVLRLLAFNHSKEPLEHDVSQYLDDFMYVASTEKFVFTKDIEERLTDLFRIIAKAYQKGEAFKALRDGKPKGGFSTNIFDAVASGIYNNLPKIKAWAPKKVQERIRTLQESHELKEYSGAGSNTRKKMLGRVTLGTKWFSK